MKHNATIKILFLAFSLIAIAALLPHVSWAAEYNPGWEIIPNECRTGGGEGCNLNSFVQMFVNLSRIMLNLLPYLSMLVIIVGGFRLLTSAGRAQEVQHGKNVLINALLGIFIVLVLAWIVSFTVVWALTGEDTGEIFAGSFLWWNPGGENVDQALPGMGCCFIKNVGCFDFSKTDCDSKIADFPSILPAEKSWTETQTCASFTDCVNLKVQSSDPTYCCATDDTDTNGNPDSCKTSGGASGCLLWPDHKLKAGCNTSTGAPLIVCDTR